MSDAVESEVVQCGGRNEYELRLTAIEVELAVIRASGATKDDLHQLRNEMLAGHERILALLYEHKLHFQTAMAQQREDFNAALSTLRYDFSAALSAHHEDQHAALAKVQIDLHKSMMSHMWKLYGFASLMLAGVYFIARYVH